MTTSSELLATFGLRASPFSKEIDDGDLWLPESKTTLVADIEEALSDRQSVLLLGEPGVGKTCVLRALRRRLPHAGFRLTYSRNSTLGRRDFYRILCHTLGLHPTATAANLFLAIETHVHDLRRDKVHPVFLLDEAHLLHPDMLAHLHILMNYEWDAKALLSLVLVGLPELEGNLSRRAHRSLLTRIHHRFLIPPASVEDTAEYVRFRLAAAGTDRALFPDDALAALHELSQGALREIDRLATAALREASRRKKKLVDREVVTRVAEALVRFD
jgi:type II secretory pathway predicted ATPase ExeA